MSVMMLEKSCAGCGDSSFVVDTSQKNQGHKKYCSDDCRKNRHCRKEQQRRDARPLTDEQRAINDTERTRKIWEARRHNGTDKNHTTPECRARISATLKRRYAAGEIAVTTYEHTPEMREKASQGMLLAYREGRANPTGSYQNKWQVYSGPKGTINMRSKSETLFAYHLDSLGIDWQYEPQRFDLGWSTYTPDFYMPGLDQWIEVKGQWTDISLRKFSEFQRTHRALAVLAKDLLAFEEKSAVHGGKAGLSPTEVR